MNEQDRTRLSYRNIIQQAAILAKRTQIRHSFKVDHAAASNSSTRTAGVPACAFASASDRRKSKEPTGRDSEGAIKRHAMALWNSTRSKKARRSKPPPVTSEHRTNKRLPVCYWYLRTVQNSKIFVVPTSDSEQSKCCLFIIGRVSERGRSQSVERRSLSGG